MRNINIAVISIWSSVASIFVIFVFGAYAYTILYAGYVVKKYSSRLKKLLVLNEKYTFCDVPIVRRYCTSVQSKRQFDTFDCDDFLLHELKEDIEEHENLINIIKSNDESYTKYCIEYDNLSKEAIEADVQKCRLNYKIFLKHEEKLMSKIKKMRPISTQYIVDYSYTSPQGRNHYQSSCEYSVYDIEELLQKIKVGIETKMNIAYERALMTDSMRYDVLRRDGFRCVICGRSAKDGVTLHVDHIMPVSRGGKTMMSNLRTLCEQCNKGKSAKYDPNGLN